MAAGDWRCTEFRQKVISQIEEAIKSSEDPNRWTKNPAEMESEVYSKAKTKVSLYFQSPGGIVLDEQVDYLINAAWLLVSIRNNLMRPTAPGQQQWQAGYMNPQAGTTIGAIEAQSSTQQVHVAMQQGQQTTEMHGSLTQEAHLMAPHSINQVVNEDWHSRAFRQKVISQIKDAVKSSKNPHSLMKDPIALESQVYSKAKTKMDYLTRLNRLLVYIRDVDPTARGLQQPSTTNTTPQPGAQFPISPINVNLALATDDWRSVAFRQKIISRIKEVQNGSGNLKVLMKDPVEMESKIYSESKTKKGYLAYIARLLAYLLEVNSTVRGPQKLQAANLPPQPGTRAQMVGTLEAQGTTPQVPMQQAATKPGGSSQGAQLTAPNNINVTTSKDWQSVAFRQIIISHIVKEIKESNYPNMFTKDPSEMESQLYSMAKTRADYLSNFARLIFCIRKAKPTATGQQQPQQTKT